jgi:putative hemolysin
MEDNRSDIPADEMPRPFRLASPFKDPIRRRAFGLMQGAMERFLMLDQVDRLYARILESMGEGEEFVDAALREMGVEVAVSDGDRARISAAGTAVVVANHPYGGIEGVLLLSLLRSVRPDVKILANYLLARMPEMDDYCIYVDPFGTERSPRANVRPLKDALRWLKDGHMLAVFPSGTVSHLDWQQRAVRDPDWSHTVARLIRHTRSPVQPVHFRGRNGNLFQLMGALHPRFRTAMLPYELLNKRDTALPAQVGRIIPYKRLERFESDDALMKYLRFRTYLLRNRTIEQRRRARKRTRTGRSPGMAPVAEAGPADALAAEVAALPDAARLLEHEDYAVYAAAADEIPHVLREIGRLREITFRAADEGTGRAVDLDRFDAYYTHLFLWNRAAHEVVGSYRIGKSDEILASRGAKGLYTRTLFRYSGRLLKELGPSLELGRSFIRPEYQKSYSALLLIWKGIGRYLLANPRYRSLFGPVSINNEYSSMSRRLLVAFLSLNNFQAELSKLVRARKPLRRKPIHEWDPHTFLGRSALDIDEISEIIGEVEQDGRGVPILLKQYIRLGGKLLSFNLDPDFSDVLDGLIYVDLLETDPKLVVRFMGREESARFLAHHGRPVEAGSNGPSKGDADADL